MTVLRLPALVFLMVLSGCGASTSHGSISPKSPLSGPGIPGHHIKTVFVILMENRNWSQIQGSSSAPYINHVLLPQASYARQYYNPPHLHPSLPNYLWLEAGTNCFFDTGCIQDDGAPSTHSTASSQHLVRLLDRAGISWRAYEENISGTSCPVQSHGLLRIAGENGAPGLDYTLYAPRHDPFVYFKDVTGDGSYCLNHVRPFTEFAGDLQRNTVARYNFITPNLCDDMHDSCPVLSNRARQGDRWLSRVIPGIQHSRAYKQGGAVMILWDEGEGGDGPIGMIVVSSDARGHGYSNGVYYTHSSTVRTIEEIFNLHPLLGGAAHSHDLRDLFRRFP